MLFLHPPRGEDVLHELTGSGKVEIALDLFSDIRTIYLRFAKLYPSGIAFQHDCQAFTIEPRRLCPIISNAIPCAFTMLLTYQFPLQSLLHNLLSPSTSTPLQYHRESPQTLPAISYFQTAPSAAPQFYPS